MDRVRNLFNLGGAARVRRMESESHLSTRMRIGSRRLSALALVTVTLTASLLVGTPPAGADPLVVTVTDGQTEQPISGAFVMVGASAGDPFPGNFGWTDAQGQIVFDDPALIGPQTVTAAMEAYGHTSVYQAAVAEVGLPLFPAEVDSSMGGTKTHVEGTVQNIGISNNDGNLDVALILPAVSASDFVLGDRLPFSFGMETLTFPIIGEIELPENSFAPYQIELFIYPFEKTPWRIDVPGDRPVTFSSVAGRISLDALLAGATLDDVEIREVGVERDVPVSGPMNLTINSDLNLSRSLTTQFAGVPAGAKIDAVSGARVPQAGREVIVTYAGNEAGIDTVSSFQLASRLPGGDMSDAVNVAVGRFADSSSGNLYSAGIVERDGFGLPHTETFDSWMLIPDLSQQGRTLQWSDATAPGVSPSPTWARSVIGLRDIGGGPRTAAWRIYAPTSGAGELTLPILPPDAPGPAGGVPDPAQTPEADELYWNCYAANPPGGPSDVAAGFLEGATHWARRWIGVEIAPTAVGGPIAMTPTALDLQAAPNPFVGETQIAWRSSLDGRGRLEIIALDGRCLHEEPVALQGDRLVWDGRCAGRRLPAGCYWALVRSDAHILGRIQLLRVE